MNLCNDIAIDAEYLSKLDASVDALLCSLYVYGILLLGATVLCRIRNSCIYYIFRMRE